MPRERGLMLRDVTGATRLYAIVGDPIAQVQSPALFNEAFAAQGRDAVLVPMQVAAPRLPEMISFFRAAQNFHGLVVTVPHKVAAIDLVDELGPRAERVGALNVIAKLPGGRLIGENFDGAGFLDGLTARHGRVAGRSALVVGAGGAGVAIADALLSGGVARLCLHDTNTARRDLVVARLAALFPGSDVVAGDCHPETFDLVVNATPVGMRGEREMPLPVEKLASTAIVADIIMKPAETPLLLAARARGLTTHEGIEMLRGQVSLIIRFLDETRLTQ